MSDHDERWVLLHLIEMCRNEERALRFAAEHISDHGVRDLLEELATRRGAFAEELVPHGVHGAAWGAWGQAMSDQAAMRMDRAAGAAS